MHGMDIMGLPLRRDTGQRSCILAMAFSVSKSLDIIQGGKGNARAIAELSEEHAIAKVKATVTKARIVYVVAGYS